MTGRLARLLWRAARELAATRPGPFEAIPASPPADLPVPAGHLRLLREFAGRNPVYGEPSEERACGTGWLVYDLDFERYWLGSTLHAASRAPFSPTWLMSAYACALRARDLGYSEAVDVGSGDGRVAFCCAVLGMAAHAVELDADLAALQGDLASILDFGPRRADAAKLDYGRLGLRHPAVLVGGLAQMGGADLARAVMSRLDPGLGAGWVLAGTASPKYAPDPRGAAGWGEFVEGAGMRVSDTLELPAAWTLREPRGAVYVFAAPQARSKRSGI